MPQKKQNYLQVLSNIKIHGAKMNKNKSIIDLIKKLAQGINTPPPDVSDGPESVGDAPPQQPKHQQQLSTSHLAPTVNSAPEVKQMQQAMQDLAQTVIQDSLSETMRRRSPSDSTHVDAAEPQKNAKKSFNDFIASNYIGSLDDSKKGVEWSQDKSVNTLHKKQESQSDIYELDAVMNTLKRIGGQKNELGIDGVWNFRTDNALRNMMGLGTALLQLEGDFGLNNGEIYSAAMLGNFAANLSGYKTDPITGAVNLKPQTKKLRAAAITKHLKGITKLYNHFRAQVTAKPAYRPMIEGDVAFDSYTNKGSSSDNLSPEQLKFLESSNANIKVTYPAPKMPGSKLDYIPYRALVSKEAYMDWMKGAGHPTEAVPMKIFEQVIKPAVLGKG